MSPTAIYSYPAVVENPDPGLSSLKGPALIIGSPSTAQDGQYQALISSLDESLNVERQMVDRLLDGGT